MLKIVLLNRYAHNLKAGKTNLDIYSLFPLILDLNLPTCLFKWPALIQTSLILSNPVTFTVIWPTARQTKRHLFRKSFK